MNVAMTARIAAKAIGRNPARSVLSCIGIGVGIAAVILAMAIGQGSKQMMVKEGVPFIDDSRVDLNACHWIPGASDRIGRPDDIDWEAEMAEE